ncbi:MAG: hypothetical protein M1325_01860 [Actinobacteria bacterium]|nr:hypothetical protein [Actinomycetota bacterium]
MRSSLRLHTAYAVEETATRHQERALILSAGRWGGAEIRPTRVFLWLGPHDPDRERVLPLGLEPRLLRVPRRRRHLEVGSCRVSFLGNPAVTLTLFAYNALKKARGHR